MQKLVVSFPGLEHEKNDTNKFKKFFFKKQIMKRNKSGDTKYDWPRVISCGMRDDIPPCYHIINSTSRAGLSAVARRA